MTTPKLTVGNSYAGRYTGINTVGRTALGKVLKSRYIDEAAWLSIICKEI
jgi:hypothetical protein